MRPEPLHALTDAGLFAFLQTQAEAFGKMLRMVLPGEAYNPSPCHTEWQSPEAQRRPQTLGASSLAASPRLGSLPPCSWPRNPTSAPQEPPAR